MSSNHWRQEPGRERPTSRSCQRQSILACGFLSKRGRAAARDTSDASATLAESDAGARCACWLAPISPVETLGFAKINSNSSARLDKEGLPFRTPLSHLQPLPSISAFGATQQPYHGFLPPSVPRAARGGAVAGGARRRAKQHELAVLRLSIGRHVHRMLLSLGRSVRDGNRRGILRRRKFHLVRLQPLQLLQWVLQGRDVRHNSQRPKQLLLLERHMVRR